MPGVNDGPAPNSSLWIRFAATPQPARPTVRSDMNAGGSMNAPASTDMGGSSNMNVAPTGGAANASATVTTDANGVQVVASQPVPDTPANRKAYGAPLSMTGKRTPPVGN